MLISYNLLVLHMGRKWMVVIHLSLNRSIFKKDLIKVIPFNYRKITNVLDNCLVFYVIKINKITKKV